VKIYGRFNSSLTFQSRCSAPISLVGKYVHLGWWRATAVFPRLEYSRGLRRRQTSTWKLVPGREPRSSGELFLEQSLANFPVRCPFLPDPQRLLFDIKRYQIAFIASLWDLFRPLIHSRRAHPNRYLRNSVDQPSVSRSTGIQDISNYATSRDVMGRTAFQCHREECHGKRFARHSELQ
jgi:hypothetical protein